MIGRAALFARRATVLQSARRMAGGGGDVYIIAGRKFGTVQVVLGVIGLYSTMIFLGTRGGSKKDAPSATPAQTMASSSSEVISVFDEGFEAWSKLPGNMDKWEKSLES